MKAILRKAYHGVYVKAFPSYHIELDRAIGQCETVLDVGCGSMSPLKFVRRRKSTGVDAYKPSIAKSRKQGIHDRYVNCEVLDIGKRFKPGSFDCVVALDVIEHLQKKDGRRLIKAMEKIAKKRVVIFTPNGFMPQGELEGNPWQVHRSGWSADEMQKLGYKVTGIHGWKPLRGELAEPKYRPKWVWFVASDITQKFVRNRPGKAFQLMCVKDVGK